MSLGHVGLFTIGVPKKGKRIQGFLWGYFLQITFILKKFNEKKLNSLI
jgi:hypothetical protein